MIGNNYISQPFARAQPDHHPVPWDQSDESTVSSTDCVIQKLQLKSMYANNQCECQFVTFTTKELISIFCRVNKAKVCADREVALLFFPLWLTVWTHMWRVATVGEEWNGISLIPRRKWGNERHESSLVQLRGPKTYNIGGNWQQNQDTGRYILLSSVKKLYIEMEVTESRNEKLTLTVAKEEPIHASLYMWW